MADIDVDPAAAAPAADSPTEAAPAAAEASAAAPDSASEIARLTGEVARLEDELRLQREDFLRNRAEVDNFKKRMQREQADALRFASESLLRGLLPILDNLERALAHADTPSVREGLELVVKGLVDLISRHGVVPIVAVGQPFDPARHEALAQVDSAEHAPGAVVNQHQVGYLLHDRLLRPALVTVNARRAEAPVESAPERG